MKRMLEVSYAVCDDGNPRAIVNINYSSLEVIQTCLRKAYYQFQQNLVGEHISAPLVFGSAVHKAMEIFYASPVASRKHLTSQCIEAQEGYLVGDYTSESASHGTCARCGAIFGFIEEARDLEKINDDKRNLPNGLDILNDYFNTHLEDPFEVFSDESGPFIERSFELEIFRDAGLIVNYFGTIDLILKQSTTGELFVADHKTTYALGKDFYNRISPNFQYTGYVMGARKAFGIMTENFMVNGIQVTKNTRGTRRQFTRRTEEDFQELTHATVHNVRRYLEALDTGIWPMNSPNPCTMYGGCTYHGVCEVPEGLRPAVIESRYGKD